MLARINMYRLIPFSLLIQVRENYTQRQTTTPKIRDKLVVNFERGKKKLAVLK